MPKFAFVVDGEVGVVWQVTGPADVELRTEACLTSNPTIIKVADDTVVLNGWKYDGETFSPAGVQ